MFASALDGITLRAQLGGIRLVRAVLEAGDSAMPHGGCSAARNMFDCSWEGSGIRSAWVWQSLQPGENTSCNRDSEPVTSQARDEMAPAGLAGPH